LIKPQTKGKIYSKTTSPAKNLILDYKAPSTDEMNASSGEQDKDVMVSEHSH
jgi:hypothetical protein